MIPPISLLIYLSTAGAPVDNPLPVPPSEDPKEYRAWRAHLPGKMQRRIANHCRQAGGEYQRVCNGIGPLAIPPPPADLDERGDWLASLTGPQRHYIALYCADEHAADSVLCGAPIVVAFGADRVELTAGVMTGGLALSTPWLARDLDGDGVISPAEIYGSPHGAAGFTALAALDANHDGKLDADDAAFASVLDWAQSDPVTAPGALSALEHVAGSSATLDLGP